MENSNNGFDLRALFRLLGKPANLDLIKALGNRKFTLPGLHKKLGRSKPLLCMSLMNLYDLGFIDKEMEGGKLRYWLKAKGVKPLIRKGKKFLDDFLAGAKDEVQ